MIDRYCGLWVLGHAVILPPEHAVIFCADVGLATGTKLCATAVLESEHTTCSFSLLLYCRKFILRRPYLPHHYYIQSDLLYMSPSVSDRQPARGCEGVLAFLPGLGRDTKNKILGAPDRFEPTHDSGCDWMPVS